MPEGLFSDETSLGPLFHLVNYGHWTSQKTELFT